MSNAKPIFDTIRLLPRDHAFLTRRVGTVGEIYLDRLDNSVRIFDGENAGGVTLLKSDLSNIQGASSGSGGSAGTTVLNFTIHGRVVSGDIDYVKITTGNVPISAIYLTKYVGSDLIAWFAIQRGEQWTIPQNQITSEMVAYGHFGPGGPPIVGGNILAGFDPLEANTTYTFWIQQTGVNTTEYVFSTDPTNYGTGETSYSHDPLAPTVVAPVTTIVGATPGEISFGNRVLVATGFRGDLTGTVSDLSNRALNDLGDVVLTSAVNGQYLTFDGQRWVNTNLTINLESLGEENLAVTGLIVRTRGELKLNDFDNTNFVSLRAPATIGTNYTLTLPASDGTSGQFLSTNGLGVLSWASASGGVGGATPPGGQNRQIQYNNNGSFGGATTFSYNDITDVVTVTTITATGRLNGTLYGDVNSTGISAFSGITVTGGTINGTSIGATTKSSGGFTTIGATGVVTLTDTSNSTTHENGTLVVKGGIGVALDVRVGGNLYVGGMTTSQDIISNSNVVVPRLPSLTTHAANKRYVDTRSIAISVALS
jgi:hypothetical protein